MDCISTKPEGWPEISEEQFKEYLLQTNDYRRDAYSNQINYYHVFNGKVFAVLREGKTYLSPS